MSTQLSPFRSVGYDPTHQSSLLKRADPLPEWLFNPIGVVLNQRLTGQNARGKLPTRIASCQLAMPQVTGWLHWATREVSTGSRASAVSAGRRASRYPPWRGLRHGKDHHRQRAGQGAEPLPPHQHWVHPRFYLPFPFRVGGQTPTETHLRRLPGSG